MCVCESVRVCARALCVLCVCVCVRARAHVCAHVYVCECARACARDACVRVLRAGIGVGGQVG